MIRPRILLADDSVLVHELARIALESVAGWELETVGSGRAALGAIASRRPDALLLDVVMPEMDGPATVRALRQDPDARDLPIVLLTALDDPGDRARLEELDVAGIVSKPFDVNNLAAQISTTLGWAR